MSTNSHPIDLELIEAVKTEDTAAAIILLNAGANPDAVDNYGRTPLHHAVRNNNPAIVELLFRHNANPDAIDNYSCTSLHYAALYDCHEIAELLLIHNANPDTKDNLGLTPLHLVANDSSKTAELIRKHVELAEQSKQLLRTADRTASTEAGTPRQKIKKG